MDPETMTRVLSTGLLGCNAHTEAQPRALGVGEQILEIRR